MKTRIPKRVYTAQYQDTAVRQVIEAGRSVAEVARSLEMWEKTLANWLHRCVRARRQSSGLRTCTSTRPRLN